MIVHGVFERFPRLRVAYMEAGCGWLPSWLHRIDEHLELAGAAEAPELTMSATEYFQRNCWISTECDDPFVADVIRWMGDDHIVFETDFPHPDSKYPHATDHFLGLDADLVPDDEQAQDPLGQRGRPVPLPRGLPAARSRPDGRGRAGERHPPAVGGGRLRRARCAAYPPRARVLRDRVARAARGDRAHASSRGCASARRARGEGAVLRAPVGATPASTRDRSHTLDDLWRGAGVHRRRHPPEHRRRTRRGATTRASRPADALHEPMRVFMSGGTTGEVAADLLHAVGPRGRRGAHRAGALHAGHPARRRRAQLVGVRHAQRRVRVRRGAAPLAQLRGAHHRHRQRHEQRAPGRARDRVRARPRSSPPATTCCASPTSRARWATTRRPTSSSRALPEHRRPRAARGDVRRRVLQVVRLPRGAVGVGRVPRARRPAHLRGRVRRADRRPRDRRAAARRRARARSASPSSTRPAARSSGTTSWTCRTCTRASSARAGAGCAGWRRSPGAATTW